MAKKRDFRESAIPKDGENVPAAGYSPHVESSVEKGRYYAYNQTRERFLSIDVEVADFSTANLELRLSTFTPGSEAALWIVPFRGLSPTSVHFPIDLVYLDEDCIVLAAVESFPISTPSPSIAGAATVLALPAQGVVSGCIQPGDRLIFRLPDEMKRYLRELQSSEANTREGPGPVHGHSTASQADQPIHGAAGQVARLQDISRSERYSAGASAEVLSPQAPAPQAPTDAASVAKSASKYAKKPKNWWQRFLAGEPPDPRRAPREPLPGLIAYFFTGGAPVAHGVRNISTKGLYVLAEERWYIGTVIRITLTDQTEQTSERSITLNAMVARWGNDGVGLQFLVQRKKDQLRSKLPAHLNPTDITSTEELEQFVRRFRQSL